MMRADVPNLVFDFDSTLVTVEGADELFARSLASASDAEERIERFRRITEQGMAGEISYEESLRTRLRLLDADPGQVAELATELVTRITPSVRRNRQAFRRHRDRIWIVSGGFEELIGPVAEWLGLPTERIWAHRLRWNADGRLQGVEPGTALARGGKALALREMGVRSPVWVVGDGITDLELRERGLAERFLAFVENCRRPAVVDAADAVLTSMDELFTLVEEYGDTPGDKEETKGWRS
jgi:D-3-phosphoglycerate dehydrogenase / 2-oxoglutarate reductase